jgi:hypothetical protein
MTYPAGLLPSERIGWNKAIKNAAQIADKWRNPSHVRLHAGEMTAQEMRSVQSVARAIADEIRELSGNDESPAKEGK